MSKAKFRLDRPDEVEMTMEVTLTLGQWKDLRSQIMDCDEQRNAPMSWLKDWIYHLVKEADKHFEDSIDA